MKNIFVLLSIMLFFSCHSQRKISLVQMNKYLLSNNYISFGDLDTTELRDMKDALKSNRLLGSKACNINSTKKNSFIYIEDGFSNEHAVYNGIVVVDNKDVCEITSDTNKFKLDSSSYIKIKEKNDLYARKVSMEDFKKEHIDEYFRYQLVIQNKVDDLKKCLMIDEYTPKSPTSLKSYYFANGKIEKFYVPFEYYFTFKKNGMDYLPYFKEDKKREFVNCIQNLNIIIE